jgi:chaperone required for assembly of F1-ATPase
MTGREAAASAARFYRTVEVVAAGRGASVLLDGRALTTPGRAPLVLPTLALAEAVAAEWRAQGPRIRPGTMHATRIANTAIDRVAPRRAACVAELMGYAATDLVLYRAPGPAALAARQGAHWDGVVAWAEARAGGRLVLAEGVVPVDQPPATLAGLGPLIAGHDHFGLAALLTMAALTGSALIALAVADGELDPARAWACAQVEEDWQIEGWGADAEASARRARRAEEFAAAAGVLAALALARARPAPPA